MEHRCARLRLLLWRPQLNVQTASTWARSSSILIVKVAHAWLLRKDKTIGRRKVDANPVSRGWRSQKAPCARARLGLDEQLDALDGGGGGLGDGAGDAARAKVDHELHEAALLLLLSRRGGHEGAARRLALRAERVELAAGKMAGRGGGG
eukprot:6210649-Pleurochrysis_carterae.AAC.7